MRFFSIKIISRAAVFVAVILIVGSIIHAFDGACLECHFFSGAEGFARFIVQALFCASLLVLAYLSYFSGSKIVATFILAVFALALLYFRSLFSYVDGLGADSLSESTDFDLKEAKFWLDTLLVVLKPKFNLGLLIVCLLGAKGIFEIQRAFGISKIGHHFAFSAVLFIVALSSFFSGLYGIYVRNLDEYGVIKSNFSGFKYSHDLGGLGNFDGRVIVYVGESTSIMNMGIYGYDLPTTPKLSELKRRGDLIVFDNVFSTHTHTAQSLLEALSFPRAEDARQPISGRSRIAVIDALKERGVDSVLVSNQGVSGSWNQATGIVFAHAPRMFSTKSSLAGNMDFKMTRPRDNEYFRSSFWDHYNSFSERLIFLHSYAGHGPYRNYVPAAYRVGFERPELSANGVVGSDVNPKVVSGVAEYDAAISYIDFSVAESIKYARGKSEPIVFIYFSDHGDSAFTGTGHDSSLMLHEMLRVPFLMYFNDAAKLKYPSLLDKYRKLSREGHPSSLAQLSSTIADIFGMDRQENLHGASRGEVIGERLIMPPLLVRNTANGLSLIDLDAFTRGSIKEDSSDFSTKIYAHAKYANPDHRTYCYHRSNSIGRIMRGRLVTNCLEVDLVVNGDELAIRHPPVADTGLRLDAVFRVARTNNMKVWIDGKNIDRSHECRILSKFLAKQKGALSGSLIEFPIGVLDSQEAIDCASDIKNMGWNISLYIPTHEASKCSESLAASSPGDDSCRLLAGYLRRASVGTKFTDISFDYSGIDAIRSLKGASFFSWNTWGVDVDSIGSMEYAGFRMIIPKSDDPNGV